MGVGLTIAHLAVTGRDIRPRAVPREKVSRTRKTLKRQVRSVPVYKAAGGVQVMCSVEVTPAWVGVVVLIKPAGLGRRGARRTVPRRSWCSLDDRGTILDAERDRVLSGKAMAEYRTEHRG